MNYEYINEFQCILFSSDTVQNDYPMFIRVFLVFKNRNNVKILSKYSVIIIFIKMLRISSKQLIMEIYVISEILSYNHIKYFDLRTA